MRILLLTGLTLVSVCSVGSYGPPPTKNKHRTTTTTLAPDAYNPAGNSIYGTGPGVNQPSGCGSPSGGCGAQPQYPGGQTGQPGYGGDSSPPSGPSEGNTYWWQGPNSPFKPGSTPGVAPGQPQFPGSNQLGPTSPGSNQPGSNFPGSNQPGSNFPGSNQPGSTYPGSNKPGSTYPGSNQPGSEPASKPIDISNNPFLSSALGTNKPNGCGTSSTGGCGGQPQYPAGKPGQSQYPSGQGQPQYPGVTPGQSQFPGGSQNQPQFPGTSPGQSQYPGVTPGQSQFPGGSQNQPQIPGTSPGQSQYPGATPGQSQFPGGSQNQPQFPGTSPGQSQYPGATPGQPQSPGGFQNQPQFPGASPGQPQYPGTNQGQPPHSGSPQGGRPTYAGSSPSQYPGAPSGQPQYPYNGPGSNNIPVDSKFPPPFPGSSAPAGLKCSAPNQCVAKYACSQGVLSQNGVPGRAGICNAATEVCCRIPTSPGQGSQSSPNVGYGNGYKPGTNGVPIGGSIYDNKPVQGTPSPVQPYTGPLNTTPYPGCPAALKCVPISLCTAEGVMSNTPVYLTREQQENRVPLTDCMNPETNSVGKCCRDPNYKDPWPAGMMMNKAPTDQGDFDDGQYHPSEQEASNTFSHEAGIYYNVVSTTPKGHTIKKPIGNFNQKPTPFPTKPSVPDSSGRQPAPVYENTLPEGGSPPGVIKTPANEVLPPQPGSPNTGYNPGLPNSGKPSVTILPQQPDQPGQPSPPGSGPSYQPQYPPNSNQPGPGQTFQPSGQVTPPSFGFPQGQTSPPNQPHQFIPGQPTPGQPGRPPTGYQPGQPGTPTTGYQPGQPIPGQPGAPATGYQPGQPGAPNVSYQPNQPTPGQPGAPVTGYQPGQTNSKQPGEYPSGQPTPGQAGLPNTGYQAGQPTPEQSGVPTTTYQPGLPTLGQQGAPVTGYQPGQPTSGQPGSPNTGYQPNQQNFGQPGSPNTGYQPGQSNFGQPGAQTTGYQPGQPTPGQPGSPTQGYQPNPTTPGQGTPTFGYQPGQPGSTGGNQPSGKPNQITPGYQPTQPNLPQQPSQQSPGQYTPNGPSTSQYPTGEENYSTPSITTYTPRGHQAGQPGPGFVAGQVAPGSSCGVRHQAFSNNPEEAGVTEFPWQAIVTSAADKKLLCGAAIISDKAVITAAHCVENFRAKDLVIKVGVWKLLSPNDAEQSRPVAAIARHPKYDAGSLAEDLAILVVTVSFTPTEHVDKICLPKSTGYRPKSNNCVVTGWGRQALKGPIPNSILHKVDVFFMENARCEETLKATQFIGKYFILNKGFSCALPKSSSDLCKVDVGGPLACDRGDGHYELAGVNSWDVGCSAEQTPTVFSNPDAEWIDNIVNTPTNKLQEDEEKYNADKLKGESLDQVDIDQKPGFALGYGK